MSDETHPVHAAVAGAASEPEAVLADEVHQVRKEEGTVTLVRIRVTADEIRPVPAGLCTRLAEAIRAEVFPEAKKIDAPPVAGSPEMAAYQEASNEIHYLTGD